MHCGAGEEGDKGQTLEEIVAPGKKRVAYLGKAKNQYRLEVINGELRVSDEELEVRRCMH